MSANPSEWEAARALAHLRAIEATGLADADRELSDLLAPYFEARGPGAAFGDILPDLSPEDRDRARRLIRMTMSQ